MEFNVNISEIKAENFIVFDKVELCLNPPKSTIFVDNRNSILTHIIDAIKFIIDSYYVDSDNAMNLLKENCKDGMVEITFLDIDSQIYYFAKRQFSNIEFVEWTKYKINEKPITKQLSIYSLQKTYFPVPPNNCNSFEINDTNNLFQSFYDKIWKGYECYLHCLQCLDPQLPANSNEDVTLKMFMLSKEFLCELELEDNVSSLFTINKLINEIFQKFTNELVGKLHFLIEANENFTIQEINQEDLNKNSKILTTIISNQEKNHCVPIIWTNLEKYLKSILKLSAKIAVAYHYSQKIVIFESTDVIDLALQQNLEYTYTKINFDNSVETWIKNNYLQNIINVSNEYKLNLIIPYHNVLKVSNAFFVTTAENKNEIDVHLLNNEDKVNELNLPSKIKN